MTASYARAKMRTWAQEASDLTGVPFHESVNMRVVAPEDVWFTLRFAAVLKEGTFCSPGYVESGYTDIVVFSKAGIGDGPAIAAIESVFPIIFAKVDPTQRFALTSYDPILEESEGSADSTYRISMQINYRFSL